MVTFRDIPGRATLKDRLASEIRENKAGHAYIFEGPVGCGKKDFALAFAYMLLCNAESTIKPCKLCRHCAVVNAGGHGELYLVETDSRSISIDTIREIQDNINLLPVISRRKVYIIADGDRMTRQAQNCLLKTLEEPPGYAHILITASNGDKFIDTIKSRAVTIQVGMNSVSEIMDYLGSRFDRPRGELEVAAQCSGGSLGKAVEILQSKDFMKQRSTAFDLVEKLLDKETAEAYALSEKAARGSAELVLSAMTGAVRDMIISSAASGYVRLINVDKKDIISKGAARYPEGALTRVAFIIEKAAADIYANASRRQTMDAMVVRITEEFAKW